MNEQDMKHGHMGGNPPLEDHGMQEDFSTEFKPERTAMQESIQRKKDRLKHVETEYGKLIESGMLYDDKVAFAHRCLASFIKEEITEDEKLLAVERISYITYGAELLSDFAEDSPGYQYSEPAEKLFNEKYGTDGK